MLKKIMSKRLMLIGIVLISIGVAFFILAGLWDSHKQKADFQKFKEASALFEKMASPEELENNFIAIARQTENKKLAAVSFYNAGTIGLNEFMADKNNSLSLKRAILYLQESLAKDPNLEKAKRNLEIALREAKENNLTNGFGLEPAAGGSGQNGEGEEGDASKNKEAEGTESTTKPLPYSDEEGYGRGDERKDY